MPSFKILALVAAGLLPALAHSAPNMVVTYGVVRSEHDYVFPNNPMGSNFNTVLPGQTKVHTLFIQNLGTSDLTVNAGGTTFTGPGSSHFSFAYLPAFPNTPAHGSRGIEITFAPTTTGQMLAALNIPSNDPNTPTFILNLEGQGGTPVVSTDLAISLPVGLSVITTYSKTGQRKLKVSGTLIPQNEFPAGFVRLYLASENQIEYLDLNTYPVLVKFFKSVRGTKNGVAKPKKFSITRILEPGEYSADFFLRVLVSDGPDQNQINNFARAPVQYVTK